MDFKGRAPLLAGPQSFVGSWVSAKESCSTDRQRNAFCIMIVKPECESSDPVEQQSGIIPIRIRIPYHWLLRPGF